MARVDGLIGTSALLRNWAVVYVANLAGAPILCLLAWLAGLHEAAPGGVAARLAVAKFQLSDGELLARGILCNALVCLAVWLSFAAHDVAGEILAIIFPISAFVALGWNTASPTSSCCPSAYSRARRAAPRRLMSCDLLRCRPYHCVGPIAVWAWSGGVATGQLQSCVPRFSG